MSIYTQIPHALRVAGTAHRQSAPVRARIGNWPDPMRARIGNWPDPMRARIGNWPAMRASIGNWPDPMGRSSATTQR
jgi:hypothetical protein